MGAKQIMIWNKGRFDCDVYIISKNTMSRSFIINKETANTFYHTNYTDHIPYPFKTKLANTNTEAV